MNRDEALRKISNMTLEHFPDIRGGKRATVGKTGIQLPSTTVESFIRFNLDQQGDAWWNSLSDSEKNNFIKLYRTEYSGIDNLWGLLGDSYTYDTNALLADLNALSDVPEFNFEAPKMSDYEYLSNPDAIYRDIDAELNPVHNAAYKRLDDERALNIQSFNDQLKSDADMYENSMKALLSNQYSSNAQVYDAMQSDMRKARQNALESGASAGIRIASNVNALLSAQNKQAQTSMDTSNALAEMLLRQRSANAETRSKYSGYISDWNSRRTNLEYQHRGERTDMYNQKYNEQLNAYNNALSAYEADREDWEDNYNSTTGTNKLAPSYLNHLRNK